MIIFALIALCTLTLAGFAAIHHARKHAVLGYEDESGFHTGIAPHQFKTAEIHEIHPTTGRAA
jgi:hypothetical protein